MRQGGGWSRKIASGRAQRGAHTVEHWRAKVARSEERRGCHRHRYLVAPRPILLFGTRTVTHLRCTQACDVVEAIIPSGQCHTLKDMGHQRSGQCGGGSQWNGNSTSSQHLDDRGQARARTVGSSPKSVRLESLCVTRARHEPRERLTTGLGAHEEGEDDRRDRRANSYIRVPHGSSIDSTDLSACICQVFWPVELGF